ncbi:hypothetical protein DFH08DRAFT_903244 [Mycena albidolilacea]|uniref:Uncharacterized protein n=1 Tax=Mycena albidolilacea TaxID=1033008 RepID=A0AAD7E9C1_9AGAR|nr:hypothetical protein DFH08DRAFT_903244 [Mycena albidolilacea]
MASYYQQRRQNIKTATSSSHHVQISNSRRLSSGGRLKRNTKTLMPAEFLLLQRADAKSEAERRAGMTHEQRRAHDALHYMPPSVDMVDDDLEDDVLQGRVAVEISHAGEAILDEDTEQADQNLLEQLHRHHEQLFAGRRRRRDYRTRRNRTQLLVDAFTAQLRA